MTVSELYAFLSRRIPTELSAPWDHDGLQLLPDPSKPVTRVAVALDLTEAVAEAAIRLGVQMILTHHPLLFHPLESLDVQNPVARRGIRLWNAGIAAASFHTRLDAVAGGVNDTLAALLGLCDPVPFGEGGMGRIGVLSAPASPSEFARLVKMRLQAPAVNFSVQTEKVLRVAVLGGSGKDLIASARAAGADTFVSGELGHHAFTDAAGFQMNLIEAGHYATEVPVLSPLAQLVREADPSLCVELLPCPPSETV